MNILLINVHSSQNAGDAALTELTIRQLQENFPGSQITLAMDDPESHRGDGRALHSFFTWLRAVSRDGRPGWRKLNLLWLVPATAVPILSYRFMGRPLFAFTPPGLRELVRAYLSADLIVSKPGGFLYHSGTGLTLLLTVYTMVMGLMAGKPLYIFPQSFGPFAHRWERLLIRKLLAHVRIVMAREPVSLQQLQACGLVHPRCYLVPDLAFAYPAASRSAAEAWLRAQGMRPWNGRPFLGVTLINWGAQNPRFRLQSAYEAAVAAAARHFVGRYKGSVILFHQVRGPLPIQDDRVPARRVAAQLSDLGAAVQVLEGPVPPDLLKALYGMMDIFIGSRMHSNIFALSEGVPVIAIGYQHKTRGIAQIAGLERWVLDIQEVSPQTLIAKLDELWAEREAVREHIRHRLPGLCQQANRAGAIIAADFAALWGKASYG